MCLVKAGPQAYTPAPKALKDSFKYSKLQSGWYILVVT